MSDLRTIDPWRAAARLALAGGGAEAVAAHGARLQAVRATAAARGAPVYLHVASVASVDAQWAVLVHRAAAIADPAERARRLPLLGVPFVVKDNIDVAGVPTTAACPAFARTAIEHATPVRRLIEAGAVWIAKTNLDQFATGLVGTRSPHGAPASVAAADRISGGSSSGSAVAVALGDVPFSLGTDTAGSGRVPAGFNGLVGLKPTPGRVGTTGVLPACRSLDCVSVFAHRVGDAAAVLAVIEGPDPSDSHGRFEPGPARWPGPLRLGFPQDLSSLSPAYRAAFDAACTRAAAAGHTLVPMAFAPFDAVASLLYGGPWVAERHSVVRELMARQPDALDPVVARVIGAAESFSATDTFEAQYRLRELQGVAERTWRSCDALLVPTAPRHPTFAEVAADPVGVNAELGRFTNFVNLLGWSAIALPAGRTADGLPFGVTLIAPGGFDAALVEAGRRWCGEAGPVPVPMPAAAGADTTPAPASLPALPLPAVAPTLRLAVVGAHLSGLPLNGQLTERGALLERRTRTAPLYRLYALPGTVPPKPGLLRVGAGGSAIEVEVWQVPLEQVGGFLALIPSPLGLGTLALEDGSSVHGFLCEPFALEGATDISRHGGWRAYLASLAAGAGNPPAPAIPLPSTAP